MKETVRRYGNAPFTVALLHGGPGAAGEMKEVAEELSGGFGVLECLQTEKSIEGQIAELLSQLTMYADGPVVLAGFSWGAWLAVLFAAKYPEFVRKVVLISAGAFDVRYNRDLMKIRMERLTPEQRNEVTELIRVPKDGRGEKWLRRFGELMESADSYELIRDCFSGAVELDGGIFENVWREAEEPRESGKLSETAGEVKCPVTAFHGEYDPHPADGVEKPLSRILTEFRMVKLAKCGHTPWRESYAKDIFYSELKEELKNTIYVA